MQGAPDLYGRPWSEPEYVLAMDAYFRSAGQPRHETSPYIRELSALLGRTPASIVMRMENFASLDASEASARRGLAKVGAFGRKVFSDWHSKRDHLRECADLLRRDAHSRVNKNLSLFEPNDVRIPHAFGRYELLDQLGEGGTARVFSCINPLTGVVGAIKIINASAVFDREALQRFAREIRILKRTEHPNVIQVHEDNLDTEQNFPAFVMDLADCSLTDLLAAAAHDRQTRPLLERPDAMGILGAVVDAARALHSANVIHRDINPNNVLRMPDGRWVLADFGLAKFVGSAPSTTAFATQTQKHLGYGTAYYAAPEQYRDFKRTDERTDVYALGVLTWELLTTVGPPFERENLGLDPAVAAAVARATERDPARRHSSAGEFGEAILEAAGRT